jgi:hypothetical protein
VFALAIITLKIMERNPHTDYNADSSDEGVKKPDKEKTKASKSKTSVHLPSAALGAESSGSGRDTAERPKQNLFDFAEANSKEEATPEKSEQAVDDLSQEEVQYIAEQVATDHLESMQDADEQTAEDMQPAIDYLERIQAGEDEAEAFANVAQELGIAEGEEAPQTEVEPEVEIFEGQTELEDDDEIDLSTNTSSSSSSGAGTPPPPSGPPVAASGSSAGPGSGSSNGAGAPPPAPGGSYNAAPLPSPAAANTLPPRAQEHYSNRRNRAGQLLLVGAVGYLIGRRRGRIKTEKQLKPVQKRLEKKVTELEQTITRREQQLVRAKAEKREDVPTKPTRTIAEVPNRTETRLQPSRVENRLQVEKPVRAERLGHMVVAAEAPPTVKVVEKVKTVQKPIIEKPSSIRQVFKAEEVPTMRRNELLELSEKIIVEGAPLRRIYESRLIGEKQLRHLVSEHLQGKDIGSDLRKEMVEHEIDFERDPMLRDRVRSHLAGDGGGSGGLSELLASVGIVDHEADLAMERRVQKEEQRRTAKERKAHVQRRAADISMMTLVVVLALAVVVLAFNR